MSGGDGFFWALRAPPPRPATRLAGRSPPHVSFSDSESSRAGGKPTRRGRRKENGRRYGVHPKLYAGVALPTTRTPDKTA
ncbi:unnamed protein product [Peronospora farinosa]|uniref:Uncharacterized protein n=1 Tax=Peronospora farinosa TaxID=134698 RepID=A0ABN8CHN6_9STRA|nr:unnamed protein product [Peronospora farinosa]